MNHPDISSMLSLLESLSLPADDPVRRNLERRVVTLRASLERQDKRRRRLPPALMRTGRNLRPAA